MIDSKAYRAKLGGNCDARSNAPAADGRVRSRPVIAAGALLFALALQCFDLRAELVFRSAVYVDGRQQWSALRQYVYPADTAYPRTLADGTQVDSEEVQVFLRGLITPQDVYGAKVMESMIRLGRQTIAGNAVSLSGNGGDVDAAMELGRLLRKLRVSTFVTREAQCLSSCVFAFMGGDRRAVAGRIGIHRPFFSSARKVPDRRVYYRRMQKRLRQYIEELDFPYSLYEAVMAVPPESMSLLSPADLKKYYLHGMSPAAEDEAYAAAARNLGISVLEYLQQKAAGQEAAAADSVRPEIYEDAQAAGGIGRQEEADAEGPGVARGVAGASWSSF